MANILIAGCGKVGNALGQRLHNNGHRVWGLRRHTRSIAAGIEPVCADLGSVSDLTRLPAGIEHVVYAAAADGFSEPEYQTAYVEGVRNLRDALVDTDQPVQRFVMVSSTSTFAQNQGEWVDENSPAEPSHFSGRSLIEAEQLVWSSPWLGIVARMGGIYGPGRGRLLRMLLSGDSTCAQGVYSNRIHEQDCASLLEHLLTLARPEPLYLGVDSEPTLLCEVLAWLAARMGLAPPRVLASEKGSSRALRSNKRCSNQRLLGSGFRFQYPNYRDGYAAILKEKLIATLTTPVESNR